MVTVVKHEWHQHDRQYTIEIDESLLAEIYPDLDEDEIIAKIQELVDGEIDVEEVINDAYDNDVEINWEFQYDDCWTDRKGGYEVTYELGDEDSYHHEPEPEPPSHKCTKCRWEGSRWETRTVYVNEQGDVLPDETEEWHDTRDGCPMCDSHVELSEFGIQQEKERQERYARWAQEEKDAEEPVPCYSCGAMHKESELPELSGQYHCPDCHQGWVMMEGRDEEPVDEEELARALEELKAEFETLTSHTHHCTECDWTGNGSDHEKEGICPNCCAYTEKYEDGNP